MSSLDPAFARTQDNIWTVNQLFNGLIQLDAQLKPCPSLATNWQIDSSGTVYTFKLRRDVFFHESVVFGKSKNRKFIASDVVYSFKRLIDPSTASPGAWIFRNRVVSDGFKALNDSTLRIELTEPFGPFIQLLANPYCFIVPREAVEYYGKDFGRHPVGTGPFMFHRWTEGIKLILHKHPYYFKKDHEGKKLPYLDAVSISFIPSKQGEFLEFLQGNLDMFNGLESSIKDQIITKNGLLVPRLRRDYHLQRTDFLNTEYLSVLQSESSRNDNSLLRNVYFRKALSLSIDRAKLIKYLRNGIGNAGVTSFCPPSLLPFSFQENAYEQSELVLDYLKRSEYKGEEITLHTTQDYLDLMILIQRQWKNYGIQCKLEVLPASVLKEQKSQGKLMLFRSSWIADYPDAENYLSCFYGPNSAPNGPNYSRFRLKRYDQLYEALCATSDTTARGRYITEMERILWEEMPMIPLFYDQSMRLSSRNWLGLENNPLNHLFLEHVQKQIP